MACLIMPCSSLCTIDGNMGTVHKLPRGCAPDHGTADGAHQARRHVSRLRLAHPRQRAALEHVPAAAALRRGHWCAAAIVRPTGVPA